MTETIHASLKMVNRLSGEERLLVAMTSETGTFTSGYKTTDSNLRFARAAPNLDGALAGMFREYTDLRHTPEWLMQEATFHMAMEDHRIFSRNVPWLTGAVEEDSGAVQDPVSSSWFKHRVLRRTDESRADGMFVVRIDSCVGDPARDISSSTTMKFYKSQRAADRACKAWQRQQSARDRAAASICGPAAKLNDQPLQLRLADVGIAPVLL